MKKKIFLIGLIATMGLSSFLLSCKKDKKEETLIGCTCTERYAGLIEVYSYDLRKMKEYDATNCSQLAVNINAYDYYREGQVNCTGIY